MGGPSGGVDVAALPREVLRPCALPRSGIDAENEGSVANRRNGGGDCDRGRPRENEAAEDAGSRNGEYCRWLSALLFVTEKLSELGDGKKLRAL